MFSHENVPTGNIIESEQVTIIEKRGHKFERDQGVIYKRVGKRKGKGNDIIISKIK